ncbi:hypothetical protein [Youngiibacter fragilis]|nr:hypothetical protein [Youngiibacter fragilis]
MEHVIISSARKREDFSKYTIPNIPAIAGSVYAGFQRNEPHGCSLSFFGT